MTEPRIERAQRRDSARLRSVDLEALIADYVAGGTTVGAICSTYRIGSSRLYRILDDHHIPRREPRRAPPKQELSEGVLALIAKVSQHDLERREAAARRQQRWRQAHPETSRARAVERGGRWREAHYEAGRHFVHGIPTDAPRRKRANGEEPPHGTEARYNWRAEPCRRCSDCRDAANAARAARKRAARARRS